MSHSCLDLLTRDIIRSLSYQRLYHATRNVLSAYFIMNNLLIFIHVCVNTGVIAPSNPDPDILNLYPSLLADILILKGFPSTSMQRGIMTS